MFPPKCPRHVLYAKLIIKTYVKMLYKIHTKRLPEHIFKFQYVFQSWEAAKTSKISSS